MDKQEKAARRVGTKGMPRRDREQLILDAAAQEFGTKGYAAGSLAEVAARAGITKPMVYEYFGSKDGLYLACLDRAGTRLVAAVESAQHGPPDITRAASTLAAVFRALEHRVHEWQLVYDPALPTHGELPAAARRYRRELNRLGAVGVAEFLGSYPAEEPLDADLATHLWYGTVGAAVTWWRHHPEQSADEMVLRLDRILTVLRPHRPAAPATTAGS